MGYEKLSTATLKKLKSGQQLDYATLPTEDLVLLRQLAKSNPKPEGPSMTESGVRGLAQGASFGFADELTGAAESLVTDKTYEQARDESRANYEKAQAANPGTYLAGDVAGSIATSFVPGLNVAKGASLAGRVGKAVSLGAASGLGYSDASDAKGMAADTALGATLGGVFQYGGEKVLDPVLKKVTDGKWLAKKAGKAFANIDEDITDKYLNNPARYQDNAVKPLEVLKEEIDANSRNIVDSLDSSRMRISNVRDEYDLALRDKVRELDELYRASKDSVGESKTAYMEAIRNKREELDEMLRSARDSFSNSKQDLNRASGDLVNELKSTKPSTEVVDKLSEAISILKDQVSHGSSASFDALQGDGVNVSRGHLVRLINDARKSLQIADGVAPLAASPARKHYDTLIKTILDIRNMPKSLEGSSVKRIIQDLDDTINFVSQIGGMSGRADSANMMIRGGLDKTLKTQSPSYNSIMETTARKTDLLSKLNKGFGTKEQILNRILELPNDNMVYKRELLDQLANETGVKVDDLLHDYMSSQRILKDPSQLQKAKEMLPEFSTMKQAENRLSELDVSPMQRNRIAKESLLESPEALAFKQAEEKLASMPQTPYDRKLSAQQAIDKETDFLSRISDAERMLQESESAYNSKYVSESGSEPLIKRFLSGRKSIEDEKLVSSIGGNLSDDIDALRVNQAFEKPDVAGSRRTLMGQAVGKMIGMGIGSAAGSQVGGDYGAGAGAIAGFSMDRHAGKIFRAMLNGKIASDQVIKQIAPKLGKYAGPLMEAAKRGNKSLAATHFILSQRDPEYRQVIESMEADDGQ